MFRKIDRLRYIVRDIKDEFVERGLAGINKNLSKLVAKGKMDEATKEAVLSRIGMYHISVDVTGKDVQVGSEVKLDVSPMFVDSSIRREYI